MLKLSKQRNLPLPNGGFTLIELLVVIFIISIVTSIALLTIKRNESKEIAFFTNELAQILTLAEEQAMLQPAVLGLSLDADTFHFALYKANPNAKKEVWLPLDDRLLGKHSIPHNIQLDVVMGEPTSNNSSTSFLSAEKVTSQTPQIIISTNGDITPFTIYVGKKGQSPRYAIQGNSDGTITTQLLS